MSLRSTGRRIFVVLVFLLPVSTGYAQKNRGGYQEDSFQWQRSVSRDQDNQIWFGFGLTPDCQTLRGWNVSVVRQPQHGQVTLQRTPSQVTPAWADRPHMNPRQLRLAQQCVGREVLVITVRYRPRRGFVGVDNLSFIVTSGDATRRRTHDVTLQVQ